MVYQGPTTEAIVFTQLIASRPARSSTAQGTTVSLMLHGALLTLAIIATAQHETLIHGDPKTRIIDIDFRPPQPTPPAPAPAAPQVTAAPEPIAPVVEPTPIPDAPAVVPTTIAPPSTEPWTPAAPAPTTGDPTADPNATGDPGGSLGNALGLAEVDVPASLLPRSPLPRYPDVLKSRGLTGGVRIRFVVGTDGRVELGTVEILESTHPAFADAVRSTLPRMRFRPARVGSRAVRQLVEIPIGFQLAGR